MNLKRFRSLVRSFKTIQITTIYRRSYAEFGRYIKRSLVGASSFALAERDIEATDDHSKAKAKKDQYGGSVAQKGCYDCRAGKG